MRGRPLIEWFVLLVILVGFLLPLTRLTGDVMHEKISYAPQSDQEVSSRLILKFAHVPSSFSCSQGDRIFWSMDKLNNHEWKKNVVLAMSDDAVEISLDISWPENVPETACAIILEPAGMASRSVTVWGNKSVRHLLEFEW